ncbi:MAG: dolichyl-phosphate beta-glucosyltransferase [Verrucomicrobiales bacterium]
MTGSLSPHILLVIPCYHESKRLPPFLAALCPALESLSFPVTIQVADDGSGEDELAKLRPIMEAARAKHPSQVPPLLELPHEGKGGTILRAWQSAPSCTTHYAFADADGAVGPSEIRRVLDEFIGSNIDPDSCAFAIRKRTATTTIKRDPIRRLMGLAYYRLVRFILGSQVYDPACGFKILSRSFWEKCGPVLTERGWALDIEILARIDYHGFPLLQIPVSWEEKGGSKIVRSDLFRILKQVVEIKQRSNVWSRTEHE